MKMIGVSPSRAIASWSLLALALVGMVRPASAQTGGRKWEVEFHAGGLLVGNPTDGSATIPGSEPFTTGTGPTGLTSRRVSSWYFGDGATLLNQLFGPTAFNRPLTMTSLDPVLSGLLANERHGGSVGFRVSRTLTARFGAEFSLDYGLARLEITDEAVRGIEASRGSFLAAWYQLYSTGSFLQPRVTSTADIQSGGARQLVSTGAVNINLKTSGNLMPYVTAGLGVVSQVGDPPSATLTGNYQFMWLNAFPFRESDIVAVRDSRPDHAVVGVVGVGTRLQASPRWGVRFDARALLGRNEARTLVDANPSVTPGAPATVFWSNTSPSIQFSSQSTPRSSLSGPRLEGVETFEGSGAERRLSVTAGVYWRF